MADRYWVGNGGSWWSTSHWSNTSGGSGGYSVPTNADNAWFDASSFNTTGVVDCGATKISFLCLDFYYLNQDITLSNLNTGVAMSCYGNCTFSSRVTVSSTAWIYLEGPQANTGYPTESFEIWNSPNFAMSILLNSNKNLLMYGGVTTGTVRVDYGTLEFGASLQCSTFTFSGSSAKTVNLNTYNLICTSQFDNTSAYSTFNSGDGKIYVTGLFDGGGKTYGKVELQGATAFSGNNTINQLTTTANTTALFPNGSTTTIKDFNFANNVTLGAFTGTATINYTGMTVTSKGTGLTLTNMTLNTPNAPVNTKYWIGNTGNWSVSTNWSTMSGFYPNTVAPTFSQNAVFDNNSFSATSQTVTMDTSSAYCLNLDFSSVTNSPTLTDPSGYGIFIYGSLIMSSAMSVTSFNGYLMFKSSTGNRTITTAGKIFYAFDFYTASIGNWTLQDDLTLTYGITHGAGSLNTNDKTLTMQIIQTYNTASKVITLGSSTINLSSQWNMSVTTGLVFNCGKSKIVLAGSNHTFYGGGLTYYSVELGGGNMFVTGANTFEYLKFNPPSVITFPASTIQNVKYIESDGSLGNLIAFISSSSGTPFTLNILSGLINRKYYSIQDCTITGTGVLNFTKTTNVSGNTGVNFKTNPSLKWYNGSAWNDTCDLGNCDSVDGINFRTDSGKLQFSYDGVNWFNL